MSKVKVLLRRWHRRLLLLLLGVTLALIIALAYKIHEKNEITQTQNLTIRSNAWISVMRQSYSVISAIVQQDYETYTSLQEAIGEEAGFSGLALASNISYESRILESIGRLNYQLSIEENMLGVLYLPIDGEAKVHWFFEGYPYKDTVQSLIKDIQRLEQSQAEEGTAPIDLERWVESSGSSAENASSEESSSNVSSSLEHFGDDSLPDLAALARESNSSSERDPVMSINLKNTKLRLLNVHERYCMLLTIHLGQGNQVVCVMEPAKEFEGFAFHIKATDESGVQYLHNTEEMDEYSHTDSLFGLQFAFSSRKRPSGFLAIILPVALLILILILYQSHTALVESHTHELTGLPNIKTFDKSFKNALRRPGITFLFFMDLRNLKLLNSIFLEEQADEVIKLFAKTMRSTLDRNDHVIHRSGDEVLMILTVVDVDLLEPILNRIKKVFSRKTVRLLVRQNKDRNGNPLTIFGKSLTVGSFVDLPICFRMGGMVIDSEAWQMPRKQLLDQANLLAEEAKSLESESIPDVVWLVKYRLNEQDVLLKSPPPEESNKLRLVLPDKKQSG